MRRLPVNRRPNEVTTKDYPEDASKAIGPTILIVSNGSRWAGEEPADLNTLLDCLACSPLDPRFEDYGNFIDECPISCKTEQPLLPVGWQSFGGNFYEYSHCFQLTTNDPQAIAELTAAIRKNQATKGYADAKADTARKNEIQRKEDEERARLYRLRQVQSAQNTLRHYAQS